MMNKNYNGLRNKLSSIAVVSIIAVFGFGAFSCASSEIADSKDVNQEKIHMSYSVVYDASVSDSYTATAQFRFGGSKGTTLRLSDPSKVFINDEEMNENSDSFSGCYYQNSISGKSGFTFLFIDTEKKEYVNKAKINTVEIAPVDIIDADKKTVIHFKGLPLEAGETVYVIIEDNEGNRVDASSDILGSDNIVILPENMQSLVAGTAEVQITRSKNFDLEQKADEGGNFYVEYKSEKISVTVKKIAVAKPVE
jgi:hypothetical protein